MSPAPNKLGLALSGGGYRAAAFHLGTLKALHRLGVLSKADVLSTISGGSIAGAYYCLKKEDFDDFEIALYNKLQNCNVIKRVLFSLTFLKVVLFFLILIGPAFYSLFTPYAWLFPILLALFIFMLLKYQFHIFPVSREIEKIYNEFFYSEKTLGGLPDHPKLIIGSTNLQTARPFSFSKYWMQDTTYQYLKKPIKFKSVEFPLARAVMASSCVPFAFTPIAIDKQFFLEEADAEKIHPLLVDGGVYDNQGIHKITQNGEYACENIIVSDAGGGSTGELNFKNTIALLITTMDVFMARIKKVQMAQDVYNNAAFANKQIAYFSLAWDIESCIPGFIDNLEKKQVPQSVIDSHQLNREWVEHPKKYETEISNRLKRNTDYDSIFKPTPEEKAIARNVGTNLTALSRKKIDCLIKQAEALTELQVKLYCPTIIN